MANAVNVAYCNGNTGQLSFKTSNGIDNWIDKYLFGWVKGDNAGVIFGIKKEDVLKTGSKQIKDGVLTINGGTETQLLNEKFVSSLKKFNGPIKGLASRLGQEWGKPIFWGTVFSNSRNQEGDITCNKEKVTEENWNCDWGIIDVSRVARAESLFALGSAGGAPLLLLGEFGQVSKPTRTWDMKVENKEGASITFVERNGAAPNQLLKGRWTFLNKGKSDESNLFNSGSFDIAVPEKSLATAHGEPSLATNIARILYCNASKGGNMVEAKVNGSRSIYCKDVTSSWHYGFIRGNHYGATFAVKPKGILKEEYKSTSLENLAQVEGGRTGIIHDTLLEILKLAAKPKNEFSGLAGNVNSGGGSYGAEKYKKDWCGENLCFLWGTIASKSSGGNDSANNCREDNSLEVCDIGIIDVSRYTEKIETSINSNYKKTFL